jgi:NADH:ubiquinone oxidoreductase subunit 2 (subunit N)
VIGLAYYLTWAAQLFRRPASAADQAEQPVQLTVGSWTSSLAVTVCLLLTLLFSVAPSLALGLVDRL